MDIIKKADEEEDEACSSSPEMQSNGRFTEQRKGSETSPISPVQKRRERSARVLITIVLAFLFCHAFRFSLKTYEVTHPSHSTAEHHMHCLQQNKYHVPVILYAMLHLHHLLLVVNSSINFIIYCCVGERFRSELKAMFSSLFQFLTPLNWRNFPQRQQSCEFAQVPGGAQNGAQTW